MTELGQAGNLDWTGGTEPSDPLRPGLLVLLASAAGTDAENKRHQMRSRDVASGEAALQLSAVTDI